jgi:hypothetical protein
MVSSSPKPLQFSPDGWRNITITNQRNPKYFALDRSFTVPLDYVKDGAQILRYLYYNRGSEEKVFMCVAKQVLYFDGTNYGYYYTLLYKGEVDLINYKHDGPKVTVNIMEGGAVKLIKANENTTYEYPLDDAESVRVLMNGVRLHQSANYLLSNGALVNDLGGHTVSVDLLAIEAITSIGAQSQKRVKTGNNPTVLWPLGEFFLVTGAAETTIELNWDFNMLPQLASGITPVFGTRLFLQVHVLESNVSDFTYNIDQKGGGDPALLYNHTQHFAGSTTLTIPANRKCVLYMSASLNRDFTFFTYQNNGTFAIKYTYVHPATYPLFFKPLTLLKKLINSVTNGEFEIDSDLLGIEFPTVYLTSGDGLRGLAGAKIKTSLSQFFNSFNTVFGIGLGLIADRLRLEKKSFWVDYSSPIILGEISKFRCSPAQDYIFNSLKIGYPDQEYEDVNGKQEFNNTHEYSFPNTRLSKVLEMVSNYRADCFGEEFYRINLEGKSTTDSKADNEVFMVHVVDKIEGYYYLDNKPVYHLDRSLNAGAIGILEPATVFNLFLSPKHCMLRNGSFYHSLFYKQDNKYVVFQTTEKNAEVVTDVVEKADVEIADFDTALFTPNLLEFETKVPVNLIDLLNDNPLKAFQIIIEGRNYLGIPVKVSSRPADRASQEYQLLSAPQNDLTQLETYNG